MSLNRAFTIVELLVVIAILSVLAAIFFVVSGPSREAALVTGCKNNLGQIRTALLLYAADCDCGREELGGFPDDLPSMPAAIATYGKSNAVLFCPRLPVAYHAGLASSYRAGFLVGLDRPGPATDIFKKTLQQLGGRTALITCTVHDDLVHRHSEKHIHPEFAHPLYVELTQSHAILYGRSYEHRSVRPLHPTRIRL
jgi:prepilin-type N-terminal cleavage/methylation domain-containing protein